MSRRGTHDDIWLRDERLLLVCMPIKALSACLHSSTTYAYASPQAIARPEIPLPRVPPVLHDMQTTAGWMPSTDPGSAHPESKPTATTPRLSLSELASSKPTEAETKDSGHNRNKPVTTTLRLIYIT